MKPKDFSLCGHDTYIDLWPFIKVVEKYSKPYEGKGLYHKKGFTRVLDRVENQVVRLRWCKGICFAHQAWCVFDFNTTDPDTLARRLLETQKKLANIAKRYGG